MAGEGPEEAVGGQRAKSNPYSTSARVGTASYARRDVFSGEDREGQRVQAAPDGEKCGAAACSVLVVFVGVDVFLYVMLFSPFSFLFSRVFCAWESESLR